MLSINTNLSSLIAQSSMSSATNKLNQAIERMTTGYKINHASDNAANYSISTNMTTKINSYMVAEDNVSMGLDMLATANGSIEQISDKLTRLRTLAIQVSNGTYGQQSLTAVNGEVNALVDEISRIYSTAEYNGIKIFQDTIAVDNMVTITEAKAAGSFISGEVYSINSAQELCDFRDMVNAGHSGIGATFVLAKDIDLKGINWTPIGIDDSNSFKGTFDGNGHIISNLVIDTISNYQGLFGYLYINSGQTATIQNVGLESVRIKGGTNTGALIGYIKNYGTVIISNNYVTGDISGVSHCVGSLVGRTDNLGNTTFSNNYVMGTVFATGSYVGGFVGNASNNAGGGVLTFNNNYATSDVIANGTYSVGGFVGYAHNLGKNFVFNNNYATGDVEGTNNVGGFVGRAHEESVGLALNNNYATGDVEGTKSVGGFVGFNNAKIYANNASIQADSSNIAVQLTNEEIQTIYTPEIMGFTETNGWAVINGIPRLDWEYIAQRLSSVNYLELQVGVNADENSRLGLELGFDLGYINALRDIGKNISYDFISDLDTMLASVSAKEVEFGAAQNRLESALDEISIQYENLVSSRSTLRDADIAQVSSTYIQQQILQQAAATLLATANQSPSIALQLI